MVDAIIESVGTSNTKSARGRVTISFPMKSHAELFAQLGGETGNAMRVTFEPLAQQMALGEDPNAGVEVTTRRAFESTTGDIVYAHAFKSSTPDGACDECGHGVNNEVHSDRLIAADKLVAQASETPATAKPAGPGGRGRRNGRSEATE